MKAGVTGLILPAEWKFGETLDRIKSAGYTALEPALRDSGYFGLSSSAEEVRDLAKRAEDSGVELVSACTAVRGRSKDVMSNDQGIRRESIATIRECMRLVGLAGIDTMLLTLGKLTPDLYYDDAYRNALSALREIAPIAQDMGIKLAIEYIWNKFLLSPMEFARFCDEVGSPNVGFYFDPGNMTISGFPEHWVRICARHLMAVHVKDFRREGYQWTPLLEGDVSFSAVMAELRKTGFDGALVSEVDLKLASLSETAESILKIAAM